MRKSRKWREKRGERRKSPLIMRGPTKWVPIKKENKITRQMDFLITNKQLGYIEKVNMAEGLEKIKIQSQNPYHEVFSEVEKVAYQLIKKLNLNSK